MAKILTVKDNTSLTDNNIGDLIATYDDIANIYAKDDFLNLPEFNDLESALLGGNAETILSAKMALAQKVCKKEQYLILTDIFEVIEFSEKTLTELQDDIKAVEPARKICWVDPDTQVVKELKQNPVKLMRYENGEFKHNLDVVENNTVINSEVVVK